MTPPRDSDGKLASCFKCHSKVSEDIVSKKYLTWSGMEDFSQLQDHTMRWLMRRYRTKSCENFGKHLKRRESSDEVRAF